MKIFNYANTYSTNYYAFNTKHNNNKSDNTINNVTQNFVQNYANYSFKSNMLNFRGHNSNTYSGNKEELLKKSIDLILNNIPKGYNKQEQQPGHYWIWNKARKHGIRISTEPYTKTPSIFDMFAREDGAAVVTSVQADKCLGGLVPEQGRITHDEDCDFIRELEEILSRIGLKLPND